MADIIHKNLTGADAVHPAAYVATSDPGAVGAHKFWVDTTTGPPYQLKKRNSANSAWENVGSTATVSGEITAQDFKATGLTGAVSASRYVGATASAAPVTGTFAVGDAVIDQTGKLWICTTAGSPGTFTQANAAMAGNFSAAGTATFGGSTSVANGQSIGVNSLTELTTIAAAATTTTTIAIPAGAIVLAVPVRVTVAIPTAATFTVIGNTSTTVFQTAAVSTAVDSTDRGTAAGAFYNSASQTIRITPNATPATNAGRVRVTIFYWVSTPPTS